MKSRQMYFTNEQRVLLSNKKLLIVVRNGDFQGRPRIWHGGQNFFFQIWKLACREAMRFARGVRGMLPQDIFLNDAIWCVLVYILIRFCL